MWFMSHLPTNSVLSSFFSELTYRSDSRELVVGFPRGGVYLYQNIDPVLYGQLTNSLFPGSFYNSYIKGRFPVERIR